MKLHPLSILAVAVLFAPIAASAADATSRVSIAVRLASHSDRKDLKGTNADTVTQHKTLQIQISGSPALAETRTVRWATYGRDLGTREVVAIDSGEFPLDLRAGGRQFVETKETSTTSTAAHAVVTGSARRPRVHKVEGQGVRFIGYRVEVRAGAEVVGEFSEPHGLQPTSSAAAQ